MSFEIEVLEREGGRFIHAGSVVINHGEERPVSRGGDRRKEAVELVLGEVFREAVSHSVDSWAECDAPTFNRLAVKVPAG